MTAPERITSEQSTATDSIAAKRAETRAWFGNEWTRLRSLIQQMEADAWADSSDAELLPTESARPNDAADRDEMCQLEEVTADPLARLASQIDEQLRSANSGGAN